MTEPKVLNPYEVLGVIVWGKEIEAWQQGHDHRDEEVAKLRKVLEIAEDMLAHIECPAHGVSFDSYGATEDLWLRLVENDECTFCATHCNEDGRDNHPWRCWLDLLMAMVEDQELEAKKQGNGQSKDAVL